MSAANEQAEFMQGLAAALNSKDIVLPSFPDVVVKIRTALEDPTCTAQRLADVARTDPVLVSRLLRSVNSAFHNRAGIEIVDLDLAISRLGFESVRNTAITLAVEQLFDTSQHEELKNRLGELWTRSISLASLCYVLSQQNPHINSDNAFLCGLLHTVGELYVLTRAKDFPTLLGDAESLETVLQQWSPVVGKSIVEAWGFPDEIAATFDIDAAGSGPPGGSASLTDIVAAAVLLHADAEKHVAQPLPGGPLDRLGVNAESWPDIAEPYELHVQSMRQSLAG